MTNPQPDPQCDPADAAGVLAAARSSRANADAEEARLLGLAVHWAALHSTDSIATAATLPDTGYGDTAVPVAGPGAPLVAEFSVAEFAAAIGLPTETGKAYLGEAVELRHRLPRVYGRVRAGDLPAWRARRIARATLLLSSDAAGYVDQHVAHVAHKIRVGQLDRLIEATLAQFMPEEAERRRRHAADGRCFHVNTAQSTLTGTADVWGTLDLADALDLDAAVAVAAQLKALGCTESLDVRRATALGHLARHEPTLDLTDTRAAQDGTRRVPTRRTRKIVLYLHLADSAIHPRRTGGIGRVENTRTPVTAEQIRDWCGHAGTHLTVRPVLDLDDHTHVDAYEIPDRLTETIALRDHTCVFPWCTRPARRCDIDHVVPHARGGPTSLDNLAPLCRRHHRLKTHGHWQYHPLEPGTYLWVSPHGHHYLRDHHGTRDVSHDRSQTPAPDSWPPSPGPRSPTPGRGTGTPRDPVREHLGSRRGRDTDPPGTVPRRAGAEPRA